jgi:NADPH:quinone reductase-like Zn-dependent oxidoreductase
MHENGRHPCCESQRGSRGPDQSFEPRCPNQVSSDLSYCRVLCIAKANTENSRYAYVVARTEQYIHALGKICAPFAKVCSIVQAKFDLYGTDFMSKSMTFSWDWLGSSAYHRTNVESYRRILGTLARHIDEGKLVPNLTRRLKLNLTGLKEAHQLIESSSTVGKLALGVDEPGEGAPFA